MKLVIERSKWGRGAGKGKGKLLDEHDKMCCVGFYAKKLGLKDSDLVNNYELWKGVGCNWTDSEEMGALYEINDSTDLSEPARETAIQVLFAKHKIGVTFE